MENETIWIAISQGSTFDDFSSPPHLRDYWYIHPGVLQRRSSPESAWFWTRWLHHRHGSLHHCSPRSEKMQRAVDKLITLLTKVCRPVSRRLPCRGSENEQIRILLERQKEQNLADCRAEIQKHEFQADYDRRSIQKLNEVIESQRGEIYSAHQGDEQLRWGQQLLHEQLLEQIGIFVKLMRKVSTRWKNWSDFNSIQFRGENWSMIEILSLNSQARFRNYRMKLIVWMIREIFKMLNQYAVDNPTLPVNQCFSHLIQILVECRAVLWECRAATMGRQRQPEIQSSLVREDLQRIMDQTNNDCLFQILILTNSPPQQCSLVGR